jgi:parallel beta-helix repeat protein
MSALAVSAQAAQKCVNPHGTSVCYSSISAAVSAASPGDTINVGPGTYKEFVTIAKSLSLVGAGPYSTIIDATGLSNAIYINNPAVPSPGVGVSDVVVTGFTIQNANFEGILINGASSVTIWGNHVIRNDKSLVPSPTAPACPGLTTVYPFETSEADDCGEGIHLTNVNSSVIAYNTVDNNAGGILVSDDSGPTHDNSIRNNIVTNNVYDCGITVPSHTPFGVYHNTISGNTVSGNGTSPLNGGGAGVGLFSPGGPTSNYGNSVVNNDLERNGIAGIAIHTHAPGTEILQDEVIVGNYIAHNGADSDMGLTASQTDGISLLVVGGNVSGIVISENTFEDEAEDIVIEAIPAVQVTATLNHFSQNGIAIDNLAGSSAIVNATQDWWGCPSGPGTRGCATITNVGGTVLSTPWLTSPVPKPSFVFPWVP